MFLKAGNNEAVNDFSHYILISPGNINGGITEDIKEISFDKGSRK